MQTLAASFQQTCSPSRSAWSEVGRHLALSLNSSNELDELAMALSHDDNTINVILGPNSLTLS